MAVILQVVSPPCRGSVVPMKVTYTTQQLWFPAIPLTKPTTALSFFSSLPLLVELAKLRLRRKPGYCQEWCQMVTVRGVGLFGTKGQLWAGGLWFQTTPDQRCAPASLLLCLCPWSVPDAMKRATRSPEVGNDEKKRDIWRKLLHHPVMVWIQEKGDWNKVKQSQHLKDPWDPCLRHGKGMELIMWS